MRMLLVGVPRRLRSIATRTVRAGCAAVLEKLARELPQVLACPLGFGRGSQGSFGSLRFSRHGRATAGKTL